jgi:hypothetical protein
VTTPLTGFSRRQFLAAGSLTFAAACLAPRRGFSEEDHLVEDAFKEAANAKITVQPLRRNISVLLGAGGNIAVLTGPDGKLLVEAEIVTAGPRVSAALATINADPIKQLINTHWHFDHTGGNDWVHKAGASILAQEDTKKHLLQDTRVEGWHFTHFRPRRRELFLPLFSKKTTPCTPMPPLWFLSTTSPRTRTPTSPSTSRRQTFFTLATLFGIAITPSSTTPPGAASTGRSALPKQTLPR